MSMSKIICDLVVGTSSIFCMHRINFMKTHGFMFVSNLIQLSHCLFGLTKHGANKEAADAGHYNEYQLSVIFTLPLVAAQLHHYYESPPPLVVAHVLISYVPFVNDDYRRGNEQCIAEGIIGLSVISLATICALNKNLFGLGAAGVFALGYYLVGTSPGEEFQGYQCKDLFHYILAIFNVIAAESVMQ